MTDVIYVDTGEVKRGHCGSTLKSNAIGSCIVVTAYNRENKTGIMAHIMLAGHAPDSEKKNKLKYAYNAITKMEALSAPELLNTFEICLIGAGNVLKRNDDTVCKKNITSVLDIVEQKKINIKAHALGGTQRRSVLLDTANGEVYFTEDGSENMLLWKSKG